MSREIGRLEKKERGEEREGWLRADEGGRCKQLKNVVG